MKKRVVVTGGSAISPLGSNWKETKLKLQKKENTIVQMKDWAKYKRLQTNLAAPADWTPPKLPRKKARGMGRVALLAMDSTLKALEMANLLDDPILGSGDVGVSYGSSSGNVDALFDFFSMMRDYEMADLTATSYIRAMAQTCAVNISVFLGLKGRLITTNTACTSGSSSIGLGFEAVQEGKQTIMICGGAEELSPAESAVFDTLFTTSIKNDTPKETPRPFDKKRDGLVVGEGSGTLILEELEHAQARGATIYAEIVGFGTNTDGDHLTHPNSEMMEKSLRMSIEDAGLVPEDIEYINGHGTSTVHGDIAESHATARVFGDKVPYSTIKGYTGHTLGACGAIESWLSICMMNDKWIAPNINLDEIDPECGKLDYILGDGRELNPKYFMTNNFAFGGINTSLIFKRWD